MTHTRALLSSYLSMVGIAVAVNTPPLCLTALSETFDLTDTARGVLLGALFWGFVAAILLVGPLGDRFGFKPFLVAAAVLQFSGLLLSSFAQSFALLLAGAGVLGVGSGMLEVLVSPLVSQLQPDRRTRAMNVLHGCYSVGAVAALLLGMVFLRADVSWRWIYRLMVLPAVGFGVGYAGCRLPRATPPEGGEAPRNSFWRHPTFWLMLLGMLLIAGTEIGPVQWMPAYLEEVFGFQRDTAGLGLVLFSTLMALGRFAMSRLGARRVPLQVLIVNCFFCAACLLVASVTHSRLIAVVALGSLGWFVAAFWPTLLAYTADRLPTGGATMFGALSAVGNGGGIVFPLLVGSIAETSGLRFGMGALLVLPLIASQIFLRELTRTAADQSA